MASTYRCKHIHVDENPQVSRGASRPFRQASICICFSVSTYRCFYLLYRCKHIHVYTVQPPHLTLLEASICILLLKAYTYRCLHIDIDESIYMYMPLKL